LKVLITGANGLLGQHLVKLLLDAAHHVVALSRNASRLPFVENERYKYYEADIAEDLRLHDIMSLEEPDAVIHSAAMTQVDECELDQDKCFAVNVSATTNILTCAELYSDHFIYISSDFVFDGQKGNYREEDELRSVNWYGHSKIQAEALVRYCEIPSAIVRTCLVYGNTINGTRNNIINWVKDKLHKNEKIKVVNDQLRTPTYVEDLARGIALILEKKARGIFHLSGKDVLTPYDMAVKTADHFGLDKNLIEKVDAASFTQPAKRPPKTGFIIDKARKELGYEPLSFDAGLRKMFA
jgi:dTDP-4-dehydrorhamnose reductase